MQHLPYRSNFRIFQKKMKFDDKSLEVRNILLDLKEGLTTRGRARIRLLELAEASTSSQKNAYLAIADLFPSLQNMNDVSRTESDVGSSFIHPFIQALFQGEEPNIIAHCSNKQQVEVQCHNKRLDYLVDIYQNMKYTYTSRYGEMKPSNTSDSELLLDYYRLCIFTKQGMEKHVLNRCLAIQTHDNKITFFLMNAHGII